MPAPSAHPEPQVTPWHDAGDILALGPTTRTDQTVKPEILPPQQDEQ